MIINSLLDTDFYKFTMGHAVYYNYPDAVVEYRFKDRAKVIKAVHILDQLNKEIDHLCSIEFTTNEINFLTQTGLFRPNFIASLHPKSAVRKDGFRLNRDHIRCTATKDGLIDIHIKGPWKDTIFFEVPVLSIISELYCHHQMMHGGIPINKIFTAATLHRNEVCRMMQKISSYEPGIRDFHGFNFADFGTRRRFSSDWHRSSLDKFIPFAKTTSPVVNKLHPPCSIINGGLIGTSNVKMAMDFGIKPVGTMAHEWLQAHQALAPSLKDFQIEALKVWTQTYQGDVGIALSDIVGFDAFLEDFSFWPAMTYDGARHDSGDPIKWGEKLINHYHKIGVDPRRKSAVFSDGLIFDKAIEIFNHFKNSINVSFGIGTKFTNDIPHITPPNIVIKMVRCNGKPVAKISDSPGKGMCEDPAYLDELKKTFNL